MSKGIIQVTPSPWTFSIVFISKKRRIESPPPPIKKAQFQPPSKLRLLSYSLQYSQYQILFKVIETIVSTCCLYHGFLYQLVAQNPVRTYQVNQAFRFVSKAFRFIDRVVKSDFFQKSVILLQTCATCSELPSNISTMVLIFIKTNFQRAR